MATMSGAAACSLRRLRPLCFTSVGVSTACFFYIIAEVACKLPGFLSPSTGLKSANIPNGVDAISMGPAAGWARFDADGALCERPRVSPQARLRQPVTSVDWC